MNRQLDLDLFTVSVRTVEMKKKSIHKNNNANRIIEIKFKPVIGIFFNGRINLRNGNLHQSCELFFF